MSEPALAPSQPSGTARSRDAVRQAWAERLARFPNAGVTVAQFCAAEGVAVASFYQWRRRLTEANTAAPAQPLADPRLLPIHLSHTGTAIELVLPSGVVLRLGPGVDEASLRSLLHLLGVTPC